MSPRLLALSCWMLAGVAFAAGVAAPAARAADATPAATAAAPAAPADAAAAGAPPAPALAHRPIRPPIAPMDALPKPLEPEVFTGYADAPPYSVVPRKPELPLFPCSMCHSTRKTNPTPRQFAVAPPPDGAPHAGNLRHGKGRFWCLDCHLAQDREFLHSITGQKIDFDDSPRLCGQCHSARYRDWAFGAHGKRVGNWSGERQIYACTHCHDPHAPQLAPRAPSKLPPLRAGLAPMTVVREHAPAPWQRAPQGTPDGHAAKP